MSDPRNEAFRSAIRLRDDQLNRLEKIRQSILEGNASQEDLLWICDELGSELRTLESDMLPDH